MTSDKRLTLCAFGCIVYAYQKKGGVGVSKVKKNITIDEDLLSRVYEYCGRRGIKFSQAVGIALSQLVDSERLVHAMVEMSDSLRLIAHTGQVDDNELKKQLEAVTLLCEAFGGRLK